MGKGKELPSTVVGSTVALFCHPSAALDLQVTL